jgi:methionyl aminopeptidase
VPRELGPVLDSTDEADERKLDYSLNNPDTLTKYRTAATISEKVLDAVSKLCVPGAKIVEVCQKGDKLMEEEIDKVYRGKKVNKGMSLRPSMPSGRVTHG